jgi:hypothetical protein
MNPHAVYICIAWARITSRIASYRWQGFADRSK